MKTPRGTARRLRRDKAKNIYGEVDPGFRRFWSLGGDWAAMRKFIQSNLEETKNVSSPA